MDTLDYTGPSVNKGSKGVWLGLGPPVRQLPQEFRETALPYGSHKVRVFCPGCIVIDGPDYESEPNAAERLATSESALKEWPLVVLTDEPDRAVASTMNFLWTTFTRFEPAADLYSASTNVIRHHLEYTFPIVIDARIKPTYPQEVTCRSDIAQKVTNRWLDYFPERDVEMGDAESASLTPF